MDGLGYKGGPGYLGGFLASIMPDRVAGPAKLFLLAALVNGVGNGIFNVVFQLYLQSMGIGVASIGSIFMMNAIGAFLLTIPAGMLADRYGRKKIIYLGFLVVVVAMPLALTTRNVGILMFSFLLIGLSNATGALISPVYASFFENGDMDRAFGLNFCLNIVAMSAGNLFGHIPPRLVGGHGLSQQSAYWAVAAMGMAFFFAQMPFYALSLRGYEDPARSGNGFSLRSRKVVAKFGLVAALMSLGGGVLFSLFPLYVKLKFGMESDALGNLFFLSNFVSAAASIAAPRVSRRMGALNSILLALGLVTLFYFMIPSAPSFALLTVVYIFRVGLVNMSSPLISSQFMQMVNQEELGTANSLRMTAMNGGQMVSPWLGGQLMENLSLDAPAYIGAAVYALTTIAWYGLLRGEKTFEERKLEAAAL